MEKLFAICFPDIPSVVRTFMIDKWDTSITDDLTLKSAKSHLFALSHNSEDRQRIVKFLKEESLKPVDLPCLLQYPQLLLDLLENQLSREPNEEKVMLLTSDSNGLKFEVYNTFCYQMSNFMDDEELTSSLVRVIEMAFSNGFRKGSVHILHRDIGLVYERFRRVMHHFKALGWLFEHKRLHPRTDYESKGVYVNIKYMMPDSTLLWIETK